MGREKRYTLEVLIRKRTLQKDLAAMLGVHPSTISRELGRDGMSARTYKNRRAGAPFPRPTCRGPAAPSAPQPWRSPK